ncbi:MAG: purine-nucleoside phosphorylase [Thermoanaerobaculia bacterium]|jgi:purine-nucleoside phosphorylase
MSEKLNRAAAHVRSLVTLEPTVGVILGSGLGTLVDAVDVVAAIPYGEIPGALASTVIGHSGRLVFAKIGATPVVMMQGRNHYYEGHSLDDVVFIPRLMAKLGARVVAVTNAAGGINVDYHAGDLMLISDHINYLGANPLRGPNDDELGPRFPDMSDIYSKELRAVAREVAESRGVTLREGVYLATSGPSYETPAEIRAFRVMGADAVGMSTVPEAIAYSQMGVKVLGISCITNMAAGILDQKLNHVEVLETTTRVQKEFTALMLALLERMGSHAN